MEYSFTSSSLYDGENIGEDLFLFLSSLWSIDSLVRLSTGAI